MKYLKRFNEEEIFMSPSMLDWCKELYLRNYVINDNNQIDVNGHVNISYRNLEIIPINFGNVAGSFYCDYNVLTSLKGCPNKVDGNFNCSNNKLTSLEGGPESVKKDYDCSGNSFISDDFKSIKGYPKILGGKFICN